MIVCNKNERKKEDFFFLYALHSFAEAFSNWLGDKKAKCDDDDNDDNERQWNDDGFTT